jgi:hypothetical protein
MLRAESRLLTATEDRMSFGVEEARRRVLDAMKTGKWDIVEEQLTRLTGAVRADERYRVIGEALEALKVCGGDDGAAPVRDCLEAVERLR